MKPKENLEWPFLLIYKKVYKTKSIIWYVLFQYLRIQVCEYKFVVVFLIKGLLFIVRSVFARIGFSWGINLQHATTTGRGCHRRS